MWGENEAVSFATGKLDAIKVAIRRYTVIERGGGWYSAVAEASRIVASPDSL
jgi:hypothetical protein